MGFSRKLDIQRNQWLKTISPHMVPVLSGENLGTRVLRGRSFGKGHWLINNESWAPNICKFMTYAIIYMLIIAYAIIQIYQEKRIQCLVRKRFCFM
jgi:hypothetical protein